MPPPGRSVMLAGMRPRARRVTIGAAALGAVLVAVLAIANWGTVRDHVQAWHFQLTRITKTIEPHTRTTASQYSEENLLHVAANELRCPVIVDPKQLSPIHVELTPEALLIPGTGIPAVLKKEGWRFLEQHFPRRAYVLIRDASSIEQTAERPMPKMPQRRCPQLVVEYEEPADLPPAGAERP